MSRGLRNHPSHALGRVISRRLTLQTGGLGYWAALDAAAKLGLALTPYRPPTAASDSPTDGEGGEENADR